MLKSKINYKLVNFGLFALIIYLIYQTRSFWTSAVSILFEILLPFFIAFVIAYALTPLVDRLNNYKIPRVLAVFLVLGFIVLLFILLFCLLSPIFLEQIGSVFNGIVAFFKEMSLQYSISFSTVQEQLSTTFNDTLEKIGTYISNGAINIIGITFNFISKFLIVAAALIYFLLDMDKIKFRIKRFLVIRNKRLYRYLSYVDNELGNYLLGFIKLIFISFIEYTAIYFIIGHPNALMLGTLAGVMNLIPYFGGIITNIIAAITAFVISPDLFIKTCIIFLVFSAIDGYVINPLVYGKSNKIHPLVVIISVFAFGVLFGVLGIIFALPLAIVLLSTFKFFKDDINSFNKCKLWFKAFR